MSNLESRLREVLEKNRNYYKLVRNWGGSLSDERAIAQIKEAFKAEGYQIPLGRKSGLVGSRVLEAYGTPEAPTIRMTGQEWYGRFQAERNKVYEENNMPHETFGPDWIDECAKRAAGLEVSK